MNILKKKDLIDHDVYEICTAENYPNCWNENSLYITMEDFLNLSPYLDKVIPEYHYYGPQKITIQEWELVKNLASAKGDLNELLVNFFSTMDEWIQSCNLKQNYFCIYGV